MVPDERLRWNQTSQSQEERLNLLALGTAGELARGSAQA